MKVKNFDANYALQEAVKAATNSKCKSQRGVVIWHKTGGLLTRGWNAPPHPFVCDGSEQCILNCAKTAVHAEQAALLGLLDLSNAVTYLGADNLEMLHVKIVNGEPVFSEKPSCWQCSKLILQAGIKSMWLFQKEGLVEYTALDFHEQTLKNCELYDHR